MILKASCIRNLDLLKVDCTSCEASASLTSQLHLKEGNITKTLDDVPKSADPN